MILVDSGVWIDFLADRITLQTVTLREAIGSEQDVRVGDLVLVEVLQGTRDVSRLKQTLTVLSHFDGLDVVDRRVAIQAAELYQRLRALGITPRKTIDTLIATRCIVDDIALLYSDRDFDPFVAHCGLRSAMNLDFGAI